MTKIDLSKLYFEFKEEVEEITRKYYNIDKNSNLDWDKQRIFDIDVNLSTTFESFMEWILKRSES